MSQAEKPKHQCLKQEMYPVYRLKWETLKAYLERKFLGHNFPKRRVLGDRYMFSIPEPLKPEDLVEIEKERNKDANEQPR